MQRTGEFVLGLVGGIIGLIFSVLALFVGDFIEFFTGDDDGYFYAFLGILASVGGIVSGILVRSNAKVSGWIMIVSAVVGFYALGWFYLISAILYLIGGIMAVAKKDNPTISA